MTQQLGKTILHKSKPIIKTRIMKLDVVRTQFGADATNGMLFIDGVFECCT